MRNISDKSVGEHKNHVLYSINFLFENRATYEITRKNI